MITKKSNAPGAKANQVFGGNVTGLSIVDADQVAPFCFRSFRRPMIEQHHGNAGILEKRLKYPVSFFGVSLELERSEKDAGTFTRQVLPAELTRLLFLVRPFSVEVAPQQRVIGGSWSVRNACANGFKDFRFPQVG